MLTENQVVLATCDWLTAQGWHIESHRLGTSKGDDIVARSRTGDRLTVECKGALSPRTGKPFAVTYVWRAISGAMFNSLRAIEGDRTFSLVAIAVPNTDMYRSFMSAMEPFCSRNKLYVFWVESGGVTQVWQPNNSFKADGYAAA